MAWYLSEIVSDLSPLPEVLGIYKECGPFPAGDADNEMQKQLAALLRQITINTDLIDPSSIPAEYENDEYKWLAHGYHELAKKLGLITRHIDEKHQEVALVLTQQGHDLFSRSISVQEFMVEAIHDWRNSDGVKPYPYVKKVLIELKRRNLYPCGGLTLLEMLILLKHLSEPLQYMFAFDEIYKTRGTFYAQMTGELSQDLVGYSEFLWEKLSEDSSNFHAANYPTRSTIQLMMYSGELAYGPVPDELFGIVQYIQVIQGDKE